MYPQDEAKVGGLIVHNISVGTLHEDYDLLVLS